MATVLAREVDDEIEGNFAELVDKLGDIPLERIRLKPPPGTATEKDVIAAEAAPRKRLCELIDGVLVEKAMGFRESLIGASLNRHIGNFVHDHKLGVVAMADGMLRLWPGRVRIPDVAFLSWGRLPGGRVPTKPIPELAPDLAVEVLSKSNTPREMEMKRDDYFRVGCRLVWEVDPMAQTVDVYTSPDARTQLGKDDVLDGGDVLPGFKLPLAELFGELERRG